MKRPQCSAQWGVNIESFNFSLVKWPETGFGWIWDEQLYTVCGSRKQYSIVEQTWYAVSSI